MNRKAEYFKARLEKTNARYEGEKQKRETRHKIAVIIGGVATLAFLTGNELSKEMDHQTLNTETATTEQQDTPDSSPQETDTYPQEIPIPIIDMDQYEESFKINVENIAPNDAKFYQPPGKDE